MLKTALVGCGNVSAMHFDAIEKLGCGKITAVCDVVKEKADSKAAACGAEAFYDFDDMLARADFDVLHICTPHYLHPEMAVKAMKAGKAVFCEKPVAMTYADALKVADTARATGAYFGCCFQNRYNFASREVKRLADAGELGELKGIRAFVTWDRGEDYYRADDWHGTLSKEGGGVCINQAIHTLDLAQWFAGADITDVKGSVSQKRLAGVVETEDTADALITFSNGVRAVFYGTLCYTANSPVFIEVLGSRGRAVISDDLTVITDSGKTTLPLDHSAGPKGYWGKGHIAIIEDFYDAINNNRPFAVDAQEAAKAVKIVDGIYQGR